MSDCQRSAQQEIGIERKVEFLGLPAAYVERPARVERIETHFSWVFLTERYVYKLKKPLRGEGFDFSSSDARRRNAEVEVRLNRRLAGDVYVGVVPLTLRGSAISQSPAKASRSIGWSRWFDCRPSACWTTASREGIGVAPISTLSQTASAASLPPLAG